MCEYASHFFICRSLSTVVVILRLCLNSFLGIFNLTILSTVVAILRFCLDMLPVVSNLTYCVTCDLKAYLRNNVSSGKGKSGD